MAVLSEERIQSAADAYNLYKAGSPLTDKHVSDFIVVTEDTCKYLRGLGQEFHLAWKELYLTLDAFRGFKEHRSRSWLVTTK